MKGCWTYLYRAIDRDGTLVDVFLSERQDQAAAEAFFRSARTVTDVVPARVTTDGHGAYPGAIKRELGEGVTHRTNRYLNNHLEQDHRGIKQRTHSMCGFKSFASAARCCRVYDELRHFFRVRSQRNESVSLAWQRTLPVGRMRVCMATFVAVGAAQREEIFLYCTGGLKVDRTEEKYCALCIITPFFYPFHFTKNDAACHIYTY